jgi:sugar-specific transcriptional regulator TrmB
MSINTDNLNSLLEPFGLNSEESQIYLNLLEKKTSTALKLSRLTHISRTKVYRILDKLIEKELVTQQLGSNGFIFVANDPSQIEILLNKKEGELSALRNSLPQIIDLLKSKSGSGIPGSKIFYYQGQKGLSQVNWNLLNAKGEFLSYEVSSANAYLPVVEADKLRQSLIDKNILSKTITNNKDLKFFSKIEKYDYNHYKIKYLPKDILSIEADIFIYNDVFAMCHYLDQGDIFCFEMHNQQLADMQREIFNNLWMQSKPAKITHEHKHSS